MDPQQLFCHNPDCRASGKVDRGNIGVHSRKPERYICHECKTTFTPSKGSVFYGLRYSVEFVTQVITLLAYGCPVQAIVAAFGIDERTVANWQQRAGVHCERVHQHLVQHPHDLGQVQADEIRVKYQGGIAWLAQAIAVPTRLWLAGVVRGRDGALFGVLFNRCINVRCIDRYCCALMVWLRMFRLSRRSFAPPFAPANGDVRTFACGECALYRSSSSRLKSNPGA